MPAPDSRLLAEAAIRLTKTRPRASWRTLVRAMPPPRKRPTRPEGP